MWDNRIQTDQVALIHKWGYFLFWKLFDKLIDRYREWIYTKNIDKLNEIKRRWRECVLLIDT